MIENGITLKELIEKLNKAGVGSILKVTRGIDYTLLDMLNTIENMGYGVLIKEHFIVTRTMRATSDLRSLKRRTLGTRSMNMHRLRGVARYVQKDYRAHLTPFEIIYHIVSIGSDFTTKDIANNYKHIVRQSVYNILAELVKCGTLIKEGSVYSVVGEFPNVYSFKKLKEYAERNKVEHRVKFNSKVDIYEIARKAKIIS